MSSGLSGDASKLSLRNVPVGIVIGGGSVLLMTSVLMIAIFLNYRVVRESKRRDLIALQYYEANFQTRDIRSAIERQLAIPDPSAFIWTQLPGGPLRPAGQTPPPAPLTSEAEAITASRAGDIGLGLISAGREMFAFSLTRQNGTTTVKAKRVATGSVFSQMTNPAALIYVLDQKGRLIYSSRQMSQDIAHRELVQKFIQTPMRSAQAEIKQGRRALIGAFQQIDDTNLIYFVETDPAELEGALSQALWNQITLAGLAVIALMMILVAPFTRLRLQLYGIARALQGLSQSPGDLRMPTLRIGSEFNLIQENLVLLRDSMSRFAGSTTTATLDSNLSPQPGFIEYETPRGADSKDTNQWVGCRATEDGLHWVFLTFRADPSLDPGAQRGFFAGMLPALTASHLTCDQNGEARSQSLRNGISQAWSHAFGADNELQYCFGVAERSTGNMLILTKDYFVTAGSRSGTPTAQQGTEQPVVDPNSSRILNLKDFEFVAVLPRGNSTEKARSQLSRIVSSINVTLDLPQARQQVEMAAAAIDLRATALIIRVKS